MRRSGPPKIEGNPIDSLPPLREITAAHGLLAKKSLGQNFLFDLNLTRRIARTAAPLDHATIVEVGPGPGGLTRALLAEGAQKVIAVERDTRCLAALAGIANHYPGRLEIIEGDALEIDFGLLVGEAKPARICANLPYNIATVLLVRWLEAEPWPPWFDRLILMFQREVAERIVATPLERAAYGRLAVLCNWRCETRILFDVAASAFTPPPKVTSALVELIPRPAPLPCEARHLSAVTQAAFGQRRKMLRQSLKAVAGGETMGLLTRANIDPTLRAEEIGIEGFVGLARALEEAQAIRHPPLLTSRHCHAPCCGLRRHCASGCLADCHLSSSASPAHRRRTCMPFHGETIAAARTPIRLRSQKCPPSERGRMGGFLGGRGHAAFSRWADGAQRAMANGATPRGPWLWKLRACC